MATRQYKSLKGLKKENLRDNMSDLELILTMLAESTTTEISRQQEPETFEENRQVARRGGAVAGRARQDIEAETGMPVITAKNAIDFARLIEAVSEAAPVDSSGEEPSMGADARSGSKDETK